MTGSRLAAVAIAVLLTACSGEATEMSSQVDTSTVAIPIGRPCLPSDGDGTVQIWHSMGGNATLDLLDDFVAKFEESHSIKLELRRFGGDLETIAELARTPTSDWPDIVVVSEQATRTLLDSERFLRPADCDAALGTDLLPLVRATYTVNDELVAMPFGVSVPLLIFDAAEFREAGLDPNLPPSTLTELLTASATIRDSGASPYGLVLPDWCGNFVLEQYSAKRGLPEGAPDNGRRTRSLSVNFATPENIADLTQLRDGVRQGHVKYIGPNPSNFDDLVAITSETDGATMAIHTSGALGDVIRLLEAGNFPGVELGVGPMPGPGAGSLIGGNAMWLVDPSNPDRAGRAWTVIEWMQEPTQLAQLAATVGYVPATAAAAAEPILQDRWAEYPQMKVAYDQVLATPVNDATAGIVIGPFNERSFVLFGMCAEIMADDVAPADALIAASENVNQLLDQYELQQSGEPLPDSGTSGSTTTPDARLTIATGKVVCASGVEVVGIWIEVDGGESGWAEVSDVGAGVATYRYALPDGIGYQLHVGCGGTAAAWGSSNFTPFVSGVENSFTCFDELGDDAGACALD